MQAKTYKNKALSALFLMNNVHYMVKTVESSPSLAVIGEDWIEQHKDQVGAHCISVSVSLCASVHACQIPLPCCMAVIVSYNAHNVVIYCHVMVMLCNLQGCASRALALKHCSHSRLLLVKLKYKLVASCSLTALLPKCDSHNR